MVSIIIIPCKFVNVFGHGYLFNDTHNEKVTSSKTPALRKDMNIDTWVVGTSNQLFRIGSYAEIKFSKKLSSH